MDSAGQAYFTGFTCSADFPASLGPGYDTSFNSGDDAFVVRLDAAGTGASSTPPSSAAVGRTRATASP